MSLTCCRWHVNSWRIHLVQQKHIHGSSKTPCGTLKSQSTRTEIRSRSIIRRAGGRSEAESVEEAEGAIDKSDSGAETWAEQWEAGEQAEEAWGEAEGGARGAGWWYAGAGGAEQGQENNENEKKNANTGTAWWSGSVGPAEPEAHIFLTGGPKRDSERCSCVPCRRYNILYYIKLYYTILHCIILWYSMLHDTIS